MYKPEHQVGMSSAPVDGPVEAPPLMSVGEGATFGVIAGIGAVCMVQVVEPLPAALIGSNPKTSLELGVVGAAAVVSAVLGGGYAYATQRLRQWREERQPPAPIPEPSPDTMLRVERVANPGYVKRGIFEFYMHMSKRSSSKETPQP